MPTWLKKVCTPIEADRLTPLFIIVGTVYYQFENLPSAKVTPQIINIYLFLIPVSMGMSDVRPPDLGDDSLHHEDVKVD